MAFDFGDITPQTEEMTLGGRKYVVHEASSDAAAKHKNTQVGGARYSGGELERMEGFADADLVLLSCCVTYDDGAEKGQTVPLKVVKQWPERVTKPLVEWIKEHSDMDEGEDPLKVALQKALDRDGSPVTFRDLSDWVNGWPDEDKKDKEMRHLYKLLRPTAKERAKNGQKATTGSSA